MTSLFGRLAFVLIIITACGSTANADIARMKINDQGVVFKHGEGPNQCDYLGARDLWIYKFNGTYYMNYDGAGPKAWLACLATSPDLKHWTRKGPILSLGKPGSDDSASASYGTTYFDGKKWHMYYMGTPHASPAPDYVPMFPYQTLYARGDSPAGPWIKDYSVVAFRPKPGTYYSSTACPSQIVKVGDGYMMFFSAATDGYVMRTITIARTKDLEGKWTIDPQPIVPSTEQIENTSMYYEPTNKTWFLFTNHIAPTNDYTQSVMVYWSKDLNHWNAKDKAIVVDGKSCTWSHRCIGLPGVIKVGSRLAVLYDAPGGDSTSHMKRDIGLAWLSLPLNPPTQ